MTQREIVRSAVFPTGLGAKPYVLKVMLFAIDSRRKCTASLDTLTTDTNLSKSSVKRALKVLETEGIVFTTHYRAGSSRRAERHINFDKLAEFTGSNEDPMNETITGPLSEPMKKDSQVQNQDSRVQNSTFTGPLSEPGRRKKAKLKGDCTDFEEEKKWNPQFSAGEFKSPERGLSRFESARDAGAIPDDDAYRIRFLVLWRHVGRRHGEGKIQSPGGLFVTLLKKGVDSGIWDGTEGDEANVRNFLKESYHTINPIEELAHVTRSMQVDNEFLKGLEDD